MGRNTNRWQKQQLEKLREHEPGKEDKYYGVGNFQIFCNLLKVLFYQEERQFDIII